MPPGHFAALLRRLRALTGTSTTGDTDWQLLERFAVERDEDAFAMLVSRYGSLVFGVCQRLLADGHEAEDVFQATFFVLARKAGSFRRHDSLGGWLYRVANRLALRSRARINQRRTHERQASAMLPDDGLHQALDRTPESGDPASAAAWRDLRGVLDEELLRLPEKYRRPLMLCYLEGKTNEQAARTLGCPVGSMSWQMAQAREQLRARLTRRGLTLSVGLLTVVLTENAAPAAPAPLIETATRAAFIFAAGHGVAGALSSEAVALAEGMLRTMLTSQLKLVITALIAVAVLGIGAGWLVQSAGRSGLPLAQAAPANEAAPAPAPAEARRTDFYGDPLPPAALARLGTTRLRTAGQARQVAFSPDGKRVAAIVGFHLGFFNGPARHSVVLWDVANGRQVGAALEHGDFVNCLAFSPDTKILATGSNDKKVRLWNTETGKETRCLEGHEEHIQALAFAPQGDVLASTSFDNTVRLWDVATGKERSRFTAHKGGVSSVAFSADGKQLATASYNEKILRLWDTAGTQIREFQGNSGNVTSVSLSRDGKLLTAWCTNDRVRVWDVATGQQMRQFPGSPEVVSAGLSPDGLMLACGVWNGPIRVYDLATGTQLIQLPGHPASSTATSGVAFSPDNKLLASAGAHDQTVRLWDLTTGEEVRPVGGHQNGVASVAFGPDGRAVATISGDQTVRFWDALRGEQRAQLPSRTTSPVAFTADGSTFFLDANGLSVRPVVGGAVRCLVPGPASGTSFTLSADGRALATLVSGVVQTWDPATGKAISRIEGRFRSATLSPDGKIVAGCDHQTVHLYSTETLKELRSVGGPPKSPWNVGFATPVYSPDGTLLAVPEGVLGGMDGTPREPFHGAVRLYDVATGKLRGSLRGHSGLVLAVAFSANGRLLASGGSDGTVRLWEVATRQEYGRFSGHQGSVLALAFSPNGRQLASGSADTTTLVWDVHGLGQAEPARPLTLTGPQLDEHWAALAGEKIALARQAVRVLSQAGPQSTPFLQQRLRPVTPDDVRRIDRLVQDLDSPQFQVRQQADEELERIGDTIEPALRQVLTGKPSLEMRQRAEQLLEKLEQGPPSKDRLRTLRSLEVLEDIGDDNARAVLKSLSSGVETARLTREARAALARLGKVSAP